MSNQLLKFLADESLELSLVRYLRNKDFDVISISEDSPSITDEDVLSIAIQEDRIILTNDKDFGDLVFLNKLEHAGIILFRIKSEKSSDKIAAFEEVLDKYRSKLKDNFVVINKDKVRIRTQE